MRRRSGEAGALRTMVASALMASGACTVQAQQEAAAQVEVFQTTPTIGIDGAGDASNTASSSAPASEPETIVVTGEKLGRAVQETATSVVVVTRDELEASSAGSMKDIVSSFGNVVSSAGDREISIRGVPQTGIGGEGETISVYLDGVALPPQAARFAGPLSAWDLEQVEVLRGAQSTNQGRNSLAGSVVLRSVEPTADWDARARAGVMSRDGHDFAIAGGGPITDSLRFRLSLQDRYENGDVVNTTRDEDDAGRERTRNGRARLAWMPQAWPAYRVQYGYTESNNEFGDPLHDSSGGKRTETSDVRGNEDDETKLHSLEQSLDIGDAWRLESISGWTGIENLYTIDFDRSASDGGYSDNTLDEDILSQELRLRFAAQGFRAVVGGYYADSDKQTSTIGYDVATAGGAVLLNGFIDSDSRTRTAALFAEADWDVLAALRLTAGLRLSRERSRRHDVSDLTLSTGSIPIPDPLGDLFGGLLPGTVPPDYDVRGRERFTDLLPKVGITWFATERGSISLTYQEGYRSGGTSVSFFGGSVSPFDPETTRTLELALRQAAFDNRLALNANLFYTRWRDQQVTIGETSGFQTITENAGKSHYFGLETEASWRFEQPFDVFASIGLLHTEFDEFVNDGQDYEGNEFPNAPEHTANLGLRLRPWHRLSGEFRAQRIAAFYGDADNDPQSRADARTLLHAKLSYALPYGFTIAAYGRNLTDDTNQQGALVAGTRLASRYGEARSFGALLEWQM